MKMRFGDVFPFKFHNEFEEDSQSRLFSVISKINSGEQVWCQLVLSPVHETAGYHLKRRISLWWNRIKKIFNIRDRVRAKDEKGVIKVRTF